MQSEPTKQFRHQSILNKTQVKSTIKDTAKKLKLKSRMRRIKNFAQQRPQFVAFMSIPLALAFIYYFAIASERYVSQAKFDIRQTGSHASPTLDLGFITASAPNAREDDLIIKEFILSHDMLAILDKRLDLKKRYQNKSKRDNNRHIDMFSRLSSSASNEAFLEYYRSLVSVHYDETSSILTVTLQDYGPKFAKKMLEIILEESEKVVNNISFSLASKQLNFVKVEMDRAEETLKNAKRSLIAFQNKHKLTDPQSISGGLISVINTLENSLAGKEAELKSLKSYINPGSPQVIDLQSKIKALKQQIDEEGLRLAGGTGVLNEISSEFESLRIEAEFALGAYKSSLNALEKARIEASHQLKNLVVIVNPNLPDEALYPKKWYNMLTILLCLLLTYGIGFMLIATIKDHSE